jgi:hypothetical protein
MSGCGSRIHESLFQNVAATKSPTLSKNEKGGTMPALCNSFGLF